MILSELRNKLVQLGIRWIFVVVPTIVIGYITLVYVNQSFTLFNSTLTSQAVYFGLGVFLAYSLYFFRVRWLLTFIALWLVYWFVGKAIAKLPGEFDVFYASAKYQLYSALFIFGWVAGFLLIRVKYSSVMLVGLLAVATIVAISNTIDISLAYILLHLVPVVIYGLYMLFLSPLLTDSIEMNLKKSARLFLRFAAFMILALLAFVLVERLLKDDLKAVETELANRGAKDNKDGGQQKKDGGYDERYGLMDKPDGDDGYRLKDTMKINSKMSQSEVLMFCSRLESFNPDGSPKPLYFVYHYLTRYDPIKETFTRDINVPSFDEFEVDPASIPLYHTRFDTSIIRKSMGNLGKVVVDADIYLASNTWKHALLAPANAFFIQTIPVQKEFQKTYLSAYKIKAYASDLNNAYFVYNPSASPMLAEIQEMRHLELSKVKGYDKVDRKFYDYYTKLPSGPLYDSIASLSAGLITSDMKPVDKVLAVRDHFLQRDEDGKRIFRYTLKPGGPDDKNIPSASMLGNFLFKTHAGYCTYYAGASLFMLRSLGIPSRFTTGFATVNRNDKNKGWYWFYASQAHAWTQVYFPEYGWLDFDMTIGNEDQHSAPKPDGTPPLPPPEPWLVLNSKAVTAPDSKTKALDVRFSQLIFQNQMFELDAPMTRKIDASLARVVYDKKDTTLSVIIPGDSLVIVSYKDEGKRIPQLRSGVSIETQLSSFPNPIIADEIHIKPRPVDKKKDQDKKPKAKTDEKRMTWEEIALLAAKIAGGVVVFVFLLPLLFLLFVVLRALFSSNAKSRAENAYRSALYQFHMAGYERRSQTPLGYAEETIDPLTHAGFADFMRVYLRLKYGSGTLLENDETVIRGFANSFGPAVRRAKGFFRLVLNYFNLFLASRYFISFEKNESENQPPAL